MLATGEQHMAEGKIDHSYPTAGGTSPPPEARVGAAMKAARENYHDPREPKKLSRRKLARRLYMSHSNLTDYENGHRFPPAEVVQAYERELKLPPGSLVGLWEQARVELLGEMRTRQRRWVPPVRLTPQSAAVTQRIPRELPHPIADFTGRSKQLATLRDLLAPGTGDSGMAGAKAGKPAVISAIDGMGGMGKSTLAIHAAHELVDAGAFPDGQLYVH